MQNKPDILEVIGARVELRRSGHEYRGFCPFHAEKNPSFFVNQNKQVFLCRGCQAARDVIDFLMRIDGLTFLEVCKTLDINAADRPPPWRTSKAATLLAQWMNQQHLLVGARCRELFQQIALAEEIRDPELLESFNIELEIL